MNVKKAKYLRREAFSAREDYHKTRLYTLVKHRHANFMDPLTGKIFSSGASTVILTPGSPHAVYRALKRRAA